MGSSPSSLGSKVGRFYKLFTSIMSEGEITQSAIVIAYYILFSIFPIIIIVGNILPLFNIDTSPISDYLKVILPDEISKFILPIVKSLLETHSTGYISFGIIFAIWSFSNLVNAIRVGMNKLYDVHRTELKLSILNFLWTRSITVLLTALMIIVFTGLSLVLIFGQQILDLLSPIFSFSIGEIKKIFSYSYPVVLLMMIIAVAYLNFVLPNIKVKKRVTWPGVFVTVIGWILLSFGFSFYLHNFPISWENYGIVGTFIIFMLWLNLASLSLLIGTSVNATIVRGRYGKVEFTAGRLASMIQEKRRANKKE